MTRKALGIIETYGYLGAIEAADVASKTANIEVLGLEKVKGGLVTVEITGDVAAVKVAVEAAESSCKKLGILVTGHVIARPAEELWQILPNDEEVDKEQDLGSEETIVTTKEEVKVVEIVEVVEEKAELPVEINKDLEEKIAQAKEMKVVDLRGLARELEGIEIPRGEIKFANKKKLLIAIEKYYRSLGDE